MTLYDTDCVTELAFVEDSVKGGVEIVYKFTDSGDHVYTVKIAGVGSDSGSYVFFTRDTLEYMPADTLAFYGEYSVLTQWATLRTHVFPESTSVSFLGVGEKDDAIDVSDEWHYATCFDFDIEPGIVVINPPNPPDTIYPDTFVVVDFTRFFLSDTVGTIHFAETSPCTIRVSSPPAFIRADANADSTITMGDAVYTLQYLFLPGADIPPCMKSADSDDSGDVTMADAIYTLRHLYLPGAPDPPGPFPSCGVDGTPDTLRCVDHPCEW
jgi:hypothetical protein